MDTKELEKQALQMKVDGKFTNEEIEASLGHEFMFNLDSFTGKYISATFWK